MTSILIFMSPALCRGWLSKGDGQPKQLLPGDGSESAIRRISRQPVSVSKPVAEPLNLQGWQVALHELNRRPMAGCRMGPAYTFPIAIGDQVRKLRLMGWRQKQL